MKLSVVLSALLLSCILFSCEKPVLTDVETLSGVPGNFTFTDTISIEVHTVPESPLASDELANHLIGSMDDPIFGKSFASLFLQYRLPSDSVSLGTGLTLDSAVIALEYSGAYGDLTVPQTFVVHEITGSISKDDTYQSDAQIAISATEAGRLNNFIPDLVNNVSVSDSLLGPHLRLKLDNAVASKILNYLNTAAYITNDDFIDFFRGIYITPDTSVFGKAIIYFDVESALSGLTLYYKQNGESKSIKLSTDSKSASVNHYKHYHNAAPVQQWISTNSQSGDTVAFLQSMSGLKAKLEFPYFDNLKGILVNKAELIITEVLPANDTVFSAPAQLIVNAVGESGENDFVLDQLEDISYFGGKKVTVMNDMGMNVAQYSFNLAKHFQQVANGAIENRGLYLLTYPSNQIADRLVIGGSGNTFSSIRLRLTYTKID